MSAGRLVLQALTPMEASAARHVLHRQLDRWHCGSTDDGLLVFAELVTNAVQHAGGAAQVTVLHGAQLLRIEVRDHSRAIPEERPAGGADGGFGLNIVGQLSQRWGWEQRADGKTVWSELPCCPEHPA